MKEYQNLIGKIIIAAAIIIAAVIIAGAIESAGVNIHQGLAYAGETLYAGYPHFHFYANLSAAVRFVEACRKEKHRYE